MLQLKNNAKNIKITRHLKYLILTLGLISCGLTFYKNEKVRYGEIKISWIDNLTGDFSFKENWDYLEGVSKNDFGQLSCNGLCPPEIDKMKDVNGKIFEDSLKAFYQLIDTTHQFHSIQSDAWAYEWAGTNFITATRINDDTLVCFTHNNLATHSSLILTITKENCIPKIKLNSIVGKTGTKIYTCKSGQIEIDKKLWVKGILKAKFDFTFHHEENPKKEMYWKGNIYATIESK